MRTPTLTQRGRSAWRRVDRHRRGAAWIVGRRNYAPVVSRDEASSYSTGGGGVTLEHQYVATLFAALLVGDPTVELGTGLP